MKVKNIVIVFVCVLLVAFTLGATGTIQLVSASENEASSPDKLIGVLVTREYLDLFDSEQFMNDNTNRLMGGGEISESESAKYQGRLYAALVEKRYTNEETGEISSGKEYVFEGINGICYFTPQMTAKFGTYWSSSGDDAITDGHINFNSTDDGESISLEGTIYVSASQNAGSFFFNPVYQSPTGEVYALNGNGMSIGDNNVAGMSMSQEIKDTQTSTIGGVTTSFESEIKVTISCVDEPVKTSILQFGEENGLLLQTDYNPGSLPDTLQVQPGTQYIIVQTTTISQDQTTNTTREIYQPEDETLFAFYCRDDGICVKQWCEIDWNE